MNSVLLRSIQVRNHARYVGSKYVQASRLVLQDFGDPVKVVKKEDHAFDALDLKDGQVWIKMVHAPINPADINTIQGVYGVKPPVPFTLGNEGFGKVQGVKNVENLQVGDWVIPANNAWGTWRTHAVELEKNLIKIPNDIDPVTAATIAVNPCTAYRLLHDFTTLIEGDTVLQNGANSAVGQSVIQICRHIGLRTVNIVRNRERIELLKNELQDLGADHVLTDEEMKTTKLFKGEIAPPKLILNCVGGKTVIDLIKAAADQAVVVTYGGMSRQPLIVPTGPLIFKDLRFVGFWMTRWNWQHSNTEREEMLQNLCKMAREGSLRPPKHKLVDLKDFNEALKEASDSSGYHGRKIIFNL